MQDFNKSIEQIVKEKQTTQNGLTSLEAKERLEKDGPNELEAPPSIPLCLTAAGSNDYHSISCGIDLSIYFIL